MQNKRVSAVALVFLGFGMFLSGCAGTISHMREVPAERLSVAPEQGKSVIVFMRPSGLGFAIQSSVFDIKGNEPSLLGIVAAKAKVAYRVDPGKYLFMVVSEAADFMSAEILPNKTYYVLVTPRMGAWKARFSLEPVHQEKLNSAEFGEWFNDCKWVEKTSDSDNWATANMPSIKSKQAEYYQKWISKSEAERPVLLPGDGK
jgi:hypothetical protein